MVPRLHNSSPAVQGNSVSNLFNGLLAELLAILDSFSSSTTSDYIGMVGWEPRSDGKNTLCSYTCFMDPLSKK